MALEISIDAKKLDLWALRVNGVAEEGILRALRSGVTFTAKDATASKRRTIDKDIDRPHAFTKRAYSWDGADRNDTQNVVARAYVRPKQAEYLKWIEEGGEKTSQPGAPSVAFDADEAFQDKFGGLWGAKGLQRKFLRPSTQRRLNSAFKGTSYRMGTKMFFYATLKTKGGELTGIWMRQKTAEGWKTKLAVRSLERGKWEPQLNFEDDVMKFGRQHLVDKINRALVLELRRLKV